MRRSRLLGCIVLLQHPSVTVWHDSGRGYLVNCSETRTSFIPGECYLCESGTTLSKKGRDQLRITRVWKKTDFYFFLMTSRREMIGEIKETKYSRKKMADNTC